MAISLDGAEITIIKAIGFGNADTKGMILAQKVGKIEEQALIDAIGGLIATGYVVCDKSSVRSMKEFEAANFCINSGYSDEIKEALDPTPERETKSKRVRRE